MGLQAQIELDYKQAMLGKNQAKVDLLRLAKSSLLNLMKEKKADSLSDEEVVKVLKQESKKRIEAINLYIQGKRQDLADKESAELKILKTYLPEEMSASDIQKIVDEVIHALGVSSPSQFGAIMGAVISRTQGRANGKLVQELVKQALNK